MRQIQIGFENRQDLIITESIEPGRRPLRCRIHFCGRLRMFFSIIRRMGLRFSAIRSTIANDLGADYV